jgi:hypothetical protein
MVLALLKAPEEEPMQHGGLYTHRSEPVSRQRHWLNDVFLGVTLLAVALCAVGEEPPYFAIRGARIVTVSGPVIPSGTVVMAKGLIVAVGTDVTIPPEAWVIDGKGLTVYPGLINALCDLGLQAAPATAGPPGATPTPAATPPAPSRAQLPQVARGPEDRPGTTPWRNPADELKTDDHRLETWRNGGFTTALAALMGGIFPGQGAVINLAGERPGEMVVKAPATLNVSFQPVGNFWSFPDSLMGVLSYVRQVFLDVQEFSQAEGIYISHPNGLQRPAYDRSVLAIREILQAGCPVLLPGNLRKEIIRAQDMAQRLGLHAVIYGGQEGYAAADVLAAGHTPVLVDLKWPEREKDADPDADVPLRVLRFRDRAPNTPGVLAKAGVPFAFYLEGSSTPKDALKNAKKAIDRGLPEEAALRAFTLSAAQILGVGSQLGSVEPGKIANLTVTDGDLFSEKTKVKMIFIDGRRYAVHETVPPNAPPALKRR